jgi:N-acetylglucosaminyldiphosphoundecaprenol N-acetyl-beta-D-mannosaminyltransferase
VGISKTSYTEIVALCRHWAGKNRTHYICVTNVYSIMLAKDHPEIARVFNEADIATPYGMAVVWALRTLGSPQQQHVYGPTLMLELCRSGLRRARIQFSGADIVFVGIGAPKQEQWMHEHRDCFPGLTLIGVGAAFDFFSGCTRQALDAKQRP